MPAPQPAPADTTPVNNHWVTTVVLTIVHPKDDTPEVVAAHVDTAVARNAPSTWGLGATVTAGSVGTHIPDDEAAVETGDDIADWYPTPAPGTPQ